MKKYIIEVSGPIKNRFMTVRAMDQHKARMLASMKIWPKKGEYILSITEKGAN